MNGSSNASVQNGEATVESTEGGSSPFHTTNSSSLSEAIRGYSVGRSDKVAFIEPRGLINTGNMCYMNSVGRICLNSNSLC